MYYTDPSHQWHVIPPVLITGFQLIPIWVSQICVSWYRWSTNQPVRIVVQLYRLKKASKQTHISHMKNENILDKICCFWPVASLPPTGTSPPPVSTLLGSVVIFPRGSQPQPSGMGSPRRSWSSTYAHLYTVQEKNVSTLKMLLFQWSITARLHLIC